MQCHIAKGKGLELKESVEDGVPPYFHCDPRRLRQILLNLIGNSIKFTDAGQIQLLVEAKNEDWRLLQNVWGPIAI